MAANAAPIDFYCEFASPYGYLASTQIAAIARRHGRGVLWRPILLGPIFKVTGAIPLAQMPIKSAYMARDIARTARALGEPMGWPDNQPTNGLHAARAFYFLNETDPAGAWRLYSACYRRYWVEAIPADTPDAVAAVAATLGHDPAALLAGMAANAAKSRLRAANDAAVAAGVFGSPFIIVDGEPFWGADRLPEVERWLGARGW